MSSVTHSDYYFFALIADRTATRAFPTQQQGPQSDFGHLGHYKN